jgi:hypothetical protein
LQQPGRSDWITGGEGDVGTFIRLEPQVRGSDRAGGRTRAHHVKGRRRLHHRSKKESDLPEWQTAIKVLMLVSRSGPTMMARIGIMRALDKPQRNTPTIYGKMKRLRKLFH